MKAASAAAAQDRGMFQCVRIESNDQPRYAVVRESLENSERRRLCPNFSLFNDAYDKPLLTRTFRGVKGWRRIANRRISSAIIKAFKSIDATQRVGINGDKE
jgi:hypothetical protein